ncbi:ribulose-phosphate 3-epimerase [Candidatus Woesearchaeota archaeon]|nr:ribulose-phosphate 3-epimerase [Candidatus Woesearchaeota archaeon]
MKDRLLFSVIAKDQKELDESFRQMKDHIDAFQLDIMDGKCVENTSLDFDFDIPESDGVLEAHLMVQYPLRWLDKLPDRVSIIIFHVECSEDTEYVIDRIRSRGKKAGIAICPSTHLNTIEPYLSKVDLVLIMTVKPGRYGSKFIEETLSKVKTLRSKHPDLIIEVDGGIDPETLRLAKQAGANRFISGSYLKKSDDKAKAVQALQRIIRGDTHN